MPLRNIRGRGFDSRRLHQSSFELDESEDCRAVAISEGGLNKSINKSQTSSNYDSARQSMFEPDENEDYQLNCFITFTSFNR